LASYYRLLTTVCISWEGLTRDDHQAHGASPWHVELCSGLGDRQSLVLLGVLPEQTPPVGHTTQVPPQLVCPDGQTHVLPEQTPPVGHTTQLELPLLTDSRGP